MVFVAIAWCGMVLPLIFFGGGAVLDHIMPDVLGDDADDDCAAWRARVRDLS